MIGKVFWDQLPVHVVFTKIEDVDMINQTTLKIETRVDIHLKNL